MKHRVLALLIVLVLSVMSVGVAAAQGGSDLKAVTTGAVTIYAEPNTGAEVVAEVAAFSEVTVLSTDPSGAWLQVDAGGNVGYAPLESFVVLNLPPLAPKYYVATNRTGATSFFAAPNVTAEFLGSLEDGTVATVLGVYEQWAYVETPQGRGWSLVSDWEALPEGARMASVVLGRVPEMGVFAEPNVTSDVIATFPEDTVLWALGEPEGEFVQVLLPGGDMGYALAANLSDLPRCGLTPSPGAVCAGTVRRARCCLAVAGHAGTWHVAGLHRGGGRHLDQALSPGLWLRLWHGQPLRPQVSCWHGAGAGRSGARWPQRQPVQRGGPTARRDAGGGQGAERERRLVPGRHPLRGSRTTVTTASRAGCATSCSPTRWATRRWTPACCL